MFTAVPAGTELAASSRMPLSRTVDAAVDAVPTVTLQLCAPKFSVHRLVVVPFPKSSAPPLVVTVAVLVVGGVTADESVYGVETSPVVGLVKVPTSTYGPARTFASKSQYDVAPLTAFQDRVSVVDAAATVTVSGADAVVSPAAFRAVTSK
jgi:hypothetical protein